MARTTNVKIPLLKPRPLPKSRGKGINLRAGNGGPPCLTLNGEYLNLHGEPLIL